MNKHLSCFIIGEGTLPIQCADILLHHGHTICGLISPDNEVQQWAKERHIPHTTPTDNLPLFMNQQPFDYLFSVVNSAILPDDILALPRGFAINYHDSPLPAYAGEHATSWALMNQETHYAVTWHRMTAQVDAGAIIKQYPVEITDTDTALTLNAKCYDAAIRAFAEMVDELASGQVLEQAQNLEQRSYFGRYKRPDAACVFSWSWDERQIDAFVRALQFGPYPNPLGLPKCVINGRFLVVRETERLPRSSQAEPGTIVAIEDDRICVATAGNDIALRTLQTIDGQPLAIPHLVRQFNLHPGYRLHDLDDKQATDITEVYNRICKHERFWVGRLSRLHPVVLPYLPSHEPASGNGVVTSVPPTPSTEPAGPSSYAVRLTARLANVMRSLSPSLPLHEVVLSAFAAYLSRLGNGSGFDICFQSAPLQDAQATFDGLFAPYAPLRVTVNHEWAFAEFHQAIQEDLARVRKRETFANDIIARYPSLRTLTPLASLTAINICCGSTPEHHHHPIPRGSLTLFLNDDTLHLTNNTQSIGDTLDEPRSCPLRRRSADPQVLNDQHARHLLEGFVTFLHNLAADPARPIHTISLLTHSERQQILVDWNKTHTDYPHDQCIHQLIESQAARTPDAIAIVSRDQHLTYHQLNQRANYLANHLRTLGVGPDMLVGICLERSIEMMVGLLAILKAGGAYVPLDPHYPHDRLALMLEDAQVPVLLTTCHLLEHLPKHHSTLICIDEHKDMREPENPVCTTTPDNLAYIIYTSGSTGTPNGVMIAHRGLVNHAIASMRMFELNPSDRMLQFSSISFDAAAEELFPTWITGGTVVLRTEEMLESFASFIDCVAHYGITILDLPTSFWHAWVTHLEQTPVRLPGSLRLVVVGAEKALVERYRTWCTIVGNSVAWLNTYGPTETTITAMAYAPDGSLDRLSDAGRGSGSVPIGRPLDNVQVYVVDSYLQPVPVGLPGELCISGVGLAHGYLKRPTMTEKRFVANPFVAEPDARMYKTGDMVRYLPDGVVEFLGRIDHQVKIRGFRIELAEIEVSLSHHPGVRDVVVLAREETPGQPYLVAYVVPKPGHNLDTPSLRSFLQEKLPDYMVPSAFVLLDELPLTPNKKIDRRALPAPDFTPCDRETYASPYTHMQKVLAGIWSTVFGNVTVGIHDNFFSLGGDSLQAMQLVAIISTEVGQHISVRDIFIYPTIATLAEALEQRLVTLPQPATTKKERDKHPSVNVNQANGSSSPIQTHTSVPYHTSFTVTIERRSLLSLVAAGQMEPVEAVIIGYQPPLELPMACLEQAGVTQDEVIHGWCDDLPVFYQAIDTYLGRIGVINLPRFENQLYTDKETLVPLIIDGLKLARQVGAKVATLANLLPVMTDGGVLLTPAIEHRTDLPLVTNRQGTTAAALVMGMRRILEEANRDMADERVGFLGLGAFATAALRLALTCLPHPQEILLCDPYSPKARLQQLQHELVVDMGFQGSVRIVETPDTHSSDFYDASMMIITSNLPDILDLNRVYPGTLIMEDLISHGSFNTRLAIQRFERDQDILFTTRATDLLVPQAISATRYLPRLAEPVLSEACLRRFALRHPFNITCCMLSGILSVRFEHLRPTIGPVDVDTCIQHYRTLEEQRFRGFDLYCKDYALPEVLIRTFRQQFGKAATYA